MTDPLSSDFDWVSVRAECSASKVFRHLELQVRADVDKRNDLRTENEKGKYSYKHTSNGNRFCVFIESNGLEPQVSPQTAVKAAIVQEFKERASAN
jgi:hypothetical protein